MADHDTPQFALNRTTILIIGAMIIAVILGAFLFVYWLDEKCFQEIDEWLKIYPNAEQIKQEYFYLRPYGLGETATLYHTPAQHQLVERWYTLATGQVNEYIRLDFAQKGWQVVEDLDGGTLIEIRTECGNA